MSAQSSDHIGGKTHEEILNALFTEAGITPVRSVAGEIVLEAKKGGVGGYTGFWVDFGFDEEGNLTSVIIEE